MSSIFEDVVSDLKGLIGSNKNGVSLYSLNNDYQNFVGKNIPLAELGYKNVEMFLRSIPKHFSIKNLGGHMRVFNVIGEDEPESNLILYHMVQNTVPKKKTYQKFDIRSGVNTGQVIREIKSISQDISYKLNKKLNVLKEKNEIIKETSLYKQTHSNNNSSFNSKLNYYGAPNSNVNNPQNNYSNSFNFNYRNNFTNPIPFNGNSKYKLDHRINNDHVNNHTTRNNVYGFRTEPIIEKPPIHYNTYNNRNDYNNGHDTNGHDDKHGKAIRNHKERNHEEYSDASDDDKSDHCTNTQRNQKSIYEVLSDSDANSVIDSTIDLTKCHVDNQTDPINYKKFPRTSWSFTSSQLTQVIVEILLVYKDFKFIVDQKYNIIKELSHNFRKLTGLSIECYLFRDMVLAAIKSSDSTGMFRSLVYSEDDRHICLNLVPSIHTRSTLPEIEFIRESQYHTELVDLTPSTGMAAIKIIRMDDVNLKWRSSFVKDWVKELIEGQLFWSWIPATMCLVRFPHELCVEYNLSNVERCVLLSCHIIPANEMLTYRSQFCLLHSAHFYLMDHNLEINNVLSTGVTYHDVKSQSHKSNETRIAYISNMSFVAKGRPSKIQFMVIQNAYTITDNLRKMRKNTSSKGQLVLYNIERTKQKKNFQTVYKCMAKIDGIVNDFTRSVEKYNDIESFNVKDVDDSLKKATVVNGYIEKEIKSLSDKTAKADEVIYISSDDEDEDMNNLKESVRQTKLESSKIETVSLVSYTSDEDPQVIEADVTVIEKNGESKHLVTSTPIAKSVQSHIVHMKSDNDAGISTTQNTFDVLNQYNQPQLVPIIPLTPHLTEHYRGETVRLMHISHGNAIILRYDSFTFIKQHNILQKLSQSILVKSKQIILNNYYLWNANSASIVKHFYNKNYQSIVLVKPVKLIDSANVLVIIVHEGLMTTLHIDELHDLPDLTLVSESSSIQTNENNTNYQQFIRDLCGSELGCFKLHLIPDWFEIIDGDLNECRNQLFISNFMKSNELVLESDSCEFFNIKMIETVEQSLGTIADRRSSNYSEKCKQFITDLSTLLFESRLCLGYFIEAIETQTDLDTKELPPITKTLSKVTKKDMPDIWFASIDVKNDKKSIYQKLTPHNCMINAFCIDRVYLDKSKNKIVLLDHDNIYIPVSKEREGLYKFNADLIDKSLCNKSEFYSRYMLCSASQIPDLSFLYKKLMQHTN